MRLTLQTSRGHSDQAFIWENILTLMEFDSRLHVTLWVTTIFLMIFIYLFGSRYLPWVTEQREEYLVAVLVIVTFLADQYLTGGPGRRE